MVGGHDASATELFGFDLSFPDNKDADGPFAFFEANDSGDDQVGAEPATVDLHIFDCSIGGDQQRQDVEAFGAGVADEFDALVECVADELVCFGGLPGEAVDEDVAVRADGCF